ncbi:MAG: substrate-binding periplasmic protein [Sphingomonadaceae bacterium]
MRVHLVLTTLLAISSSACATESVVFYLPNLPGIAEFNHTDHSIHGRAIDLLRKLTDAADLQVSFKSAPLARIVANIPREPQACGISIKRGDDNAAAFRWTDPISLQRIVVYERPHSGPYAQNINDLSGKRIGAVRASAAAKKIESLGLVPELTADALSNHRKLLMGRIDFWVSGDLEAQSIIDSKQPVEAFVLDSNTSRIACNLQMPDPIIQRLNQAIYQLRMQGQLTPFGLPALGPTKEP